MTGSASLHVEQVLSRCTYLEDQALWRKLDAKMLGKEEGMKKTTSKGFSFE